MDKCAEQEINLGLNVPKYALSTVYLYSKYCNLKCRHCWINPPYSNTRNLKEGEASLKEIISALKECQDLGLRSVKLSGGEPFIREDIFELLDFLKENNLGLNVETNGTFIKEKEAKALKEAKVIQVAVSLDGPTAELHEFLRGVPGSFNLALEGIRCLIQEKINTQIIVSLWKGNRDQIKSTILLAKELGINSVKINVINYISRGDKMAQSGETLSVKETIEFYNQLMQELKNLPPINVIFDIPPAFKPLNKLRANFCSCGIYNILGILGDGRISICGIGSTSETLILGRIGKDSIKEIWENNPYLLQIRKDVPSQMQGICGRCVLKHYCLGKCRAEAYYTSGSLLAPLSFCQVAYEEGLFPASRII